MNRISPHNRHVRATIGNMNSILCHLQDKSKKHFEISKYPNILLILTVYSSKPNINGSIQVQTIFIFVDMKKSLRYLKNKYVLTLVIFGVYSLFLEENDLFSIIAQKRKLSVLNEQKIAMEEELNKVNGILKRLKYTGEVEKYARENKYFKKDNEEIFVISYE